MAKNHKEAGTGAGQGRMEQNPNSMVDPRQSGTDPQKVKQEIQKDVNEGIGAMTSREAGSMKD
ncbi:hypothetical protein [Halobacillus faecis]|uniref:Small, acid-soluble spore protein gamma-type n=1 Tax=Halobacillus faecis TaxID=360184 RepID=A0A511WMW6_9BACI|nr:hypothetical protein [Halobacillus faecis]GEN52397.1 hypothetical protein HFA01_06590 [Halobacillus faecis]